MIRVAAFGDVHVGRDSRGTLAPHLAHLDEKADVLLIAGDLTRRGQPEEAEILAAELAGVSVPVAAVLGNHDYESGCEAEVAKVLQAAGVEVLEGDSVVWEVAGRRLGVAGVKGFGHGFPGAAASDFGEPIMKAFVGEARAAADALERALGDLDTDLRVALMHFAPVAETLRGERPEIHAFLGSYFLGEAVDRAGATFALHGHAHGGTERGTTPGGIPVRNVAQPVIGTAYRVYCVGGPDGECGDGGTA